LISNEEPASIQLGSRSIPYTLKVSPRARQLRVTIANGQMSVTVPRGLRRGNVERFLQEHAQWILAKLDQPAKRKAAPALPKDIILVRGAATRMERVEEVDRKSRAKVELAKDRLIVRVPAGSRTHTLTYAEDWLREQSRGVIANTVKVQAARMNARPTSLTIRDQRTRWGSCSTRGTLSFNWRLVMAPPAVMEYVVIHELAHLFQPNHSKDFWAVVARYAPDFKTHRAWLRKNASLLRPQS
jgi:predicted metal-dependent hydrolase